MSSEIDDDDLDIEYPEAPPVFLGRRRSSVGTTNIISEADKKEAEALARKGAAQHRERLCRSVICGLVLIAVIALLVLFTAKTLLAPELEGAFTGEKRDTARTTPSFNTSNDVSIANRSDAELDALEHTMFTSDPDVQSGPFPFKDRDENLFCGTEDCMSLVSFLNTVLSRKRDTCGRLYDRVCSRWARSHRSLAETRGRYSVDDAVLDTYREQVSRLLQDPSVLHADQRSFYADCVNGRLLTDQDIKDIANDIMLPDEGWTPETFAEAVARMSQIGVSPFFDISVKESNDLFSANLRFLDLTHVYRANGKNKQNWTSSKEKTNSINSTENVNRSNSIAFFSALERLICQEITEMSGLNKSCVPTAEIAVQAPWQSEWYTSTGPKLLAESVASMFDDLSMYSKALEEMILLRTSSRAIPASEQERTARCLRFIDQHDPIFIPQIITSLRWASVSIRRSKNIDTTEGYVGQKHAQGLSDQNRFYRA
ncbi:hypothetical protein HPB48_019929 [Haemaphysalis longicornis]|uniref:Transmembrane protein n=1 Tax=Haemaphysalis longicornis TaxID=44386 RepID=A0A9J6FVT2_HAELO|nr:hypothetical protein HPB48_019929 [Haemaphysalis longicornis]